MVPVTPTPVPSAAGRKTPFFDLLLVSVVVFIAANPVLAGEPRVVEYSWLTIGEPSGTQTTTYASDGAIRVSFEFNDRGRGPETDTKLRLNEQGMPVSIFVTGKNYRKGEVNEHFAVDAGTARWQSNVENGEASFDGSAFYMPFDAAPELLAVLARALLASADSRVDLLPTGQANITKLTETFVQSLNGSATISLYSIQGLDAAPAYIWLDENNELFGVDYGWFGITPKGWEQNIDLLKASQTQATDAHYASLADQLTEQVSGLLVVRGARVFDSLSGELTDPATVFVSDGKISAVYFSDVEIPEDAKVISATGKTLLPTLWDMHGHVGVESYLNYLASGVTNVRDMANDPEVIAKLNDDVYEGRIAGPDVYALGFIDKRGEFSAPTGRLAESIDDARSFVDFYAQRGFHGVKLYSSIEPEWVAPIAGYAHRRGLVVMGHVPAYMNATQAIRAGYNEITHINMILLNFLGAEQLDTRTPARFRIPGEKAADIDLESADVRRFVSLMKENGVAHDPTASIFMDMFRNEPGTISPTFAGIAHHLPANVRRAAIAGSGYNSGQEETYARSANKTLQMIRLLHESGIRILPGTDNTLPGFTLIRELMYYVEAGIPARDALQLGTIGPARHLNLDQRLGSITVGKDAQMFIVDGDPSANIGDLYRVEYVIKGRQMYYAPDLLRAEGFVPFVEN